MVEKYSIQGDLPLLKELDEVTAKIESFQNKIRQSTSEISRKEISDLLRVLQSYNEAIESDIFEDKKLTQTQDEQFNERVEHALRAVLSFQRARPDQVSKKNLDEMIVSLFSTLTVEVNKFQRNVENLKEKWKIVNRKVQVSQKSKES